LTAHITKVPRGLLQASRIGVYSAVLNQKAEF
jgi:hypothetical protein